jgi:hypothetical protein
MITADLVEYLGTVDGLPSVYLEVLPETPDTCIGVYTRAGAAPSTAAGLERKAVQVLVRGTAQDGRASYTIAETIYNLLHRMTPNAPIVTGGEIVQQVMANNSGPYHIGRDVKGRHEWSINFTVWVWNPAREIA